MQYRGMYPEPIYGRIGAFVKARRAQLKMRQEKLAALLGVSRATLANIETGRQRVLVHQIYNLAAALDISIGDLLPTPEQVLDTRNLPLPDNLNPAQRSQIAQLLELQPAPSSALSRTDAHDQLTPIRSGKGRKRSSSRA